MAVLGDVAGHERHDDLARLLAAIDELVVAVLRALVPQLEQDPFAHVERPLVVQPDRRQVARQVLEGLLDRRGAVARTHPHPLVERVLEVVALGEAVGLGPETPEDRHRRERREHAVVREGDVAVDGYACVEGSGGLDKAPVPGRYAPVSPWTFSRSFNRRRRQ